MKLEHVNLTVRDLEQSIDFYCSLFGWRIRWRGQNSAGRAAAHVGTEFSYLAMFQASESTVSEPLPRLDSSAPGFNHLGFVVEDMDTVVVRLRALGVQPKSDEQYDPGRHVYFIDPDGVEVELVEY